MTSITEAEFSRIVAGIVEDRDTIIKHNPIGPDDEVLLWMLLSCLISYLNLDDAETPCFTGKPDADIYRTAISFVLSKRKTDEFDESHYLDQLSK